jgi:uncharacterized protein (TIGR00369 family)
LEAAELHRLIRQGPMADFLGIVVVESDCEAGLLVLRMPFRPEISRGGRNQFHGGALATLIDLAGDFAVGMRLGGGVPTASLHIDYLRPATGAWVQARALVRRQGRTLATVDVELTCADGTLVALGRGTFVPRVG